MTDTPSVPLFTLPEYEEAFIGFLMEGVRKLMEAQDELFASIPRAPAAEHLATTQNTLPSGEVVESSPVLVRSDFETKFADLFAGNVEALAASMDRAAAANLEVVMKHLFETLAKVCDAVGNSVNAGGQPLSHDLLFQMFEKVEISFDDEGQPVMPTLVMHPDMVKRIAQLPPRTPEQEKAFNDLIERKRQRYNAKKRTRKLP